MHFANLLIVAGASIAILIGLTGGGEVTLWNLHLTLRSISRPIVLAVVGIAIRMYVDRRNPAPGSQSPVRGRRDIDYVRDGAHLGFATLLTVVLGLAVAWQVRVCGGLDSYGYVSAASLIASGTLKQTEPLAHAVPFASGIRALAPLGYVVAPDNVSIVPRFPLGFPLLMAPLLAFGPRTVFIVPLISAVAAVWIAYWFARERESWIAGWLAAALVAIDPVFFNQAIQPMSDVPATMWILMSCWLTLRERPRPFISGAAAGMAVLTRPALLIAALAIGAFTFRHSRQTFARWTIAAAPFIAAQAILQFWLYGSPLASGYGSNEHLFQLSRIPSNAANYAHWLAVVYGPSLIVAIVAVVSYLTIARAKWVRIVAVIACAVLAPYLLYVRFDDWQVTRFLLPASSLILVAAACLVARTLRVRMSERWASIAALGIVLGLGARSYAFVTREGVQNLAHAEAKYSIIGEWIRERTPTNAIIVSSLFSGSIRYYSGRTTLRWDEIPPGRLADTVAAMTRVGRICYLSLDGPEEEDLFRARFRDELSRLTMMPAGRLHGRNIETLEPRR